MSKLLSCIIGCKDKIFSWHLNGSPMVVTLDHSIMSGRSPPLYVVVFFLGGGAWLRAGEGIGWLAAGTMPNSLYRMPLVYLSLTCEFCYSCSFLFVVCVFCVFLCSHWSLVDVPLIFFCPADHVPDWQPRVLLGMVEARSVNVKKTTTKNNNNCTLGVSAMQNTKQNKITFVRNS